MHRREAKVPYLRLSGRWLEECGFAVGAPIYVKAEHGKLIVTNEDPAAAVVGVN
ncbi:MAG TPA: SymE family type I addiction module toxin [Thermoanaerobaculia bacterium]|nr:SymE family type I addiction module toxin [Thermoanaerobaculia bacterium]